MSATDIRFVPKPIKVIFGQKDVVLKSSEAHLCAISAPNSTVLMECGVPFTSINLIKTT